MPLIKHFNPKNYIDENGNMFGDIDPRDTIEVRANSGFAESAYFNKYRGGAPSMNEIIEALNRNGKLRRP